MAESDSSEERKAKRREAQRRYYQTEKGKAQRKAKDRERNQLPHRKAQRREYEKRKAKWLHLTAEEKRQANERSRRYAQTPKGKAMIARVGRAGRDALRLQTLIAYGGDPPTCMCECGCRESKIVYLDLDHVNNDGAEHKKRVLGKKTCGAHVLYRYLRDRG